MTVTVTLKGVLLTVIALLLIILLVFTIVLLRKLIDSLKQLDVILADTHTVTNIAADRVKQADEMVGEVGESLATVVEALKGNQSTVAALTHITDAASALLGILRKRNSVKAEQKEAKATKEAKKAEKAKKEKTN